MILEFWLDFIIFARNCDCIPDKFVVKICFNQIPLQVSMRPVDFSCILRVSKSQMMENGTKDAAVDGVYRGVLDYLSSQAWTQFNRTKFDLRF